MPSLASPALGTSRAVRRVRRRLLLLNFPVPPLAFPLLTLLLCVTFSAFSPYTVSSFLERRQRPWYNEK